MAGGLSKLLRAPLGPAEAYLRMLAAFGEDLATTVTDRGERDPFALRDPVYIERTLPAVRLASQLYFRSDVRGLEHIPAGGPGAARRQPFRRNADRRHVRVRPALLRPLRRSSDVSTSSRTTSCSRFPGSRALLERYGTVPASPANMTGALRRDAALLVYPGGDHETYRPSWESDQIDFAGRTGFVELALEHGIPVVPVVAIGGQETALFLGQGRRFARALGLDRRLRLKVLAGAIGPPFGLTVLDLPGRIPLPAKISIRVLKPIDLRDRLGSRPDPEEGYKLVTSTMQRTLTRLSNERTLPVVG